MNVLHVISGRGPTGPAAAALDDVKALRAAGHAAYLCTRQEPGLTAACEREGVPYVSALKLARGALKLLQIPHDVRALRRVLRELEIDVVHVHRSDDQLLASAALGRTFSARLVRTWHRAPTRVPWPLRAKLLAQVEGCVCVSREHESALQTSGTKRTIYVPTGVDTTVFKAPMVKPELPLRIGHVGRWKRDKDGRDRGQRAALDVFEALRPHGGWLGQIIGRGEQGTELRRIAYEEKRLGTERVEFVQLDEHAPARFAQALASLHLGLVFTTGSDGSSRAAAELLACGVPLLVADRPGLRELAEDTRCALRLLPDDPQSWASAIVPLLRDPARVREMSLAARARAESAHALAIRGMSLAEFYRSL